MASSFSGKAGRNAAIWTAQMAGQQLDELKGIYGAGYKRAEDKLTNVGYMPSAKALKDYYARSKKYTVTGMNRSNALINKGMTAAVGDVNQGYGQGIDTLNQMYGKAEGQSQIGVDAWKANLDRANAGYDMYSNALGLGGPEGRASAEAAFQAGPGYAWQTGEAQRGAQRAANRTGQLYGGNTTDAITRLSSNMANQEYNQWLGNLQGYQGAAGQATSGYAGQLNQLASLYANQGRDVSTAQIGQGKDLAAIHGAGYGGMAANTMAGWGTLAQGATQYGQDRASLSTNFGNALAGTSLGYMNDIAGATNNYYNTVIGAGQQGMMAGQQAAANRTGAMMGGLQLGGQILGGLFGGGGGFLGGFLGK
jgi:hypothetical protein